MRHGFLLLAMACSSGSGNLGETGMDVATGGATTPGSGTDVEAAVSGVTLQTTLGDIVIELDDEAAPKTVRNFVRYAEAGFFDGADGDGATTFHRVIPGFMIQGGGLRDDLSEKDTRNPIKNEADNGLSNLRGTIAMARTDDPDSATSQFFINHADNVGLDPAGGLAGYAVFGSVTAGLDVVDAIAAVDTESVGFYDDVPVEPVVITGVVLSSD
jgi:cyclophilin family peptidyl-prolyl cis-trans isomerase